MSLLNKAGLQIIYRVAPKSKPLTTTRYLVLKSANKVWLISDSLALSYAPAEAARPWTRGRCAARCACLLHVAYGGTNNTALWQMQMCVNYLAKVALDSAAAVSLPNHFATEPHNVSW